MDEQQKSLRKRVHALSADLLEREKTHNSYDQERREQECIRRGDPEGLERAIRQVEEEKIGVLARDSLRQYKNVAIVVIALASRSAIAGGLDPETSFSMTDAFIQQVEAQRSREQVQALMRKAEMEYCLAVRRGRYSGTQNPIIRRCRNLVSRQVNRPLTVQGLAQDLQVSPDYLSRLFAREEGISLSGYIQREKALAGARELIFTERSLDDVAASLGFSSQSHFGRVFRKWIGMTPRQYRLHFGEKNIL